MLSPSPMLQFRSKSPHEIEGIDNQYKRKWQFRRIDHNQWVMSVNQTPLSLITISRLQSSVFWYQDCRWVVMPRKMSPTFEQLIYKLDNRRKLRWTRETMSMELLDGSLVHPARAQILHLVQETRPVRLDGYLKLFNSEFELDNIASGFIAMIIWSKPDILAKVRTSFALRTSHLKKSFWERVINCANQP